MVLALAFGDLLPIGDRPMIAIKKTANAPANPMKAIVHCDYGLANLELDDIEKPTPADDQILVEFTRLSVNPYDWHFVEGTPYVIARDGRRAA